MDWTVYDLMISQLPATVKLFRTLGVMAEVNHLAFEPAILDALPDAPAVDTDVSFVGTYLSITSSGLRSWKRSPNATISNCGETARKPSPPLRRSTAASRAKFGARRCIRSYGGRA